MEPKKLIFIAGPVLAIAIAGFIFFSSSRNSAPDFSFYKSSSTAKISPSTSIKEYSDSSGFTFSYPDDLYLVKNEITDDSTYADLALYPREIRGNLNLKITDTKFTSLDDWLKDQGFANGKETKLGSLKAVEIEDKEKIIIAALDQGILFKVEAVFADQKDFWRQVQSSVVSGFVFNMPTQASSSTSTSTADDVVFEGEEIVE